MQKWKKITLGVLFCAVSCSALYYSALLIVPNVVDLNKYKNTVSEAIEKETGFKVLCEDISFKKSLTPYLKIHMFHTLVLYPDGEVFLKLKEADLKVKILPLIFKKIVIKDAKLTRPIINITLYKDYSTSIEKYIDIKKSINTNGFKFDDLVYDTVCERYKIKFNDESINKTFYLEGDKLLLKNLKLNDKVHFALKGALYENKNEYIKYDIDVISSLNTEKPQFTFSPFKTILESNIKGSILGHLKIDSESNIYGKLNISDLSIKLDNIVLSDNKADLVFKGQEVEVDSVVHTSKIDSAELKGLIAYGKKKSIDIETKAKNVNLHNLIKIISQITEVLNIPNSLSEINVSGLLDADFKLSSDFKKLKSYGKVKVSNAVVKHSSLPYSVSEINAFVNLNNNKISIEKAFAKVNKTPINIKGIINENVSFNIDVSSTDLKINNLVKLFNIGNDLPIGIEKGDLSFNSNISGVLNKSYNLNSALKIKNIRIRDKLYNIPVAADVIDINFIGNEKKYSGDVLCSNISLINKGKKIASPEFKFKFDESKIDIPENTLSIPSGLKISGILNNYKNKPIGQINFSGNLLASEIAELLKPEVKLPYKAQGKISSSGNIQLQADGINVKAHLKADEDNYISYMVINELFKKPSFVNLDFIINDSSINIKDLSLNEENPTKNRKIIVINGELSLSQTPYLKNLKVNIPESLTVATNFFGGEELSLKANMLLNKNINAPEVNGTVRLYKYNLKKYLTSFKNVDISLSNNNIRVIAPNVTVNDSSLNLVADMSPVVDFNNIIVKNLQLNSMNMDLNSMFSLLQQERNPFAESKFTVEKGIITINNLKMLDLKARDISSDVKIENNIVKLSDIAANAYSGFINGKASYDLSNGHLEFDVSGKGIDIKNSLYDLCKIEDNLAGRTDFNAKLSMSTGDYNTVLKSLNGNLQFNAVNGRMGTLGKFEYYLYAQNLLYHGILNATLNRIANTIVHDNTAQYRIATGNILFQNGYLLTDGIQTTGTNMSLFLKGRHNLITNQANIDIYGRISDEIREKLGSFGNVSISEMMSGQKGKKDVTFSVIPSSIMNKIPDLYNQKGSKTNTFKVNIYGNINSLNAINSFIWTIPDSYEADNSEKIPDFSDMTPNL